MDLLEDRSDQCPLYLLLLAHLQKNTIVDRHVTTPNLLVQYVSPHLLPQLEALFCLQRNNHSFTVKEQHRIIAIHLTFLHNIDQVHHKGHKQMSVVMVEDG